MSMKEVGSTKETLHKLGACREDHSSDGITATLGQTP